MSNQRNECKKIKKSFNLLYVFKLIILITLASKTNIFNNIITNHIHGYTKKVYND